MGTDAESRNSEWKLDSTALDAALTELHATVTVDLFASRLNSQRPCYVSYIADPEAHAVDAFFVLA